jgi:hypothetical protein
MILIARQILMQVYSNITTRNKKDNLSVKNSDRTLN